jgi:hypothetical protein|tara:strand:- start:593 stop:751 length:159 start_codon:yes stop_codon:yes gene_type:complete
MKKNTVWATVSRSFRIASRLEDGHLTKSKIAILPMGNGIPIITSVTEGNRLF